MWWIGACFINSQIRKRCVRVLKSKIHTQKKRGKVTRIRWKRRNESRAKRRSKVIDFHTVLKLFLQREKERKKEQELKETRSPLVTNIYLCPLSILIYLRSPPSFHSFRLSRSSFIQILFPVSLELSATWEEDREKKSGYNSLEKYNRQNKTAKQLRNLSQVVFAVFQSAFKIYIVSESSFHWKY